jgi:hypothetical protein
MEILEDVEQEDELTLRQEVFCRLYTQNTQLFGNGTLAYAEAYDYRLDELSDERPVLRENDQGEPVEWGDSPRTLAYNVCSVQASKLLKNPKIDRRIVDLLNEMMTDRQVDAQIVKVMMQNNDLGAKMRAINEYNKLKQRITEKLDHTTAGQPINVIIPKELADKNAINTGPEQNSEEQKEV